MHQRTLKEVHWCIFFGSTLQPEDSMISMGSNVAAVSAGYDHTMILKTDGSLWATGSNQYGRLGLGTMLETSTPVEVIFK
jgi:alpha-tubulin suppressor-like RCC1 family protein